MQVWKYNNNVRLTYSLGLNGNQSVQLASISSNGNIIGYTYDVSYDGSEIAYDGIGNPIAYFGKTLTWSKGRQLTKISDSEMDYSYSYNKDGIRTTKKNNATNAVTSY